MKNIELTEEHKVKLLEMCNKLFPEKGKFFKILCGSIYYSDNGNFPGKSIHWFEFCMTHLSTKIDSFRNDSYLISHGQSYDNAINSEHPVDYLYEEFLKLK